MEVPSLGVQSELQLPAYTQLEACLKKKIIWAAPVTCRSSEVRDLTLTIAVIKATAIQACSLAFWATRELLVGCCFFNEADYVYSVEGFPRQKKTKKQEIKQSVEQVNFCVKKNTQETKTEREVSHFTPSCGFWILGHINAEKEMQWKILKHEAKWKIKIIL